MKNVYLNQPFWSGFMWMRIGGFLAGILSFYKTSKKRNFSEEINFYQKNREYFSGKSRCRSRSIYITKHGNCLSQYKLSSIY